MIPTARYAGCWMITAEQMAPRKKAKERHVFADNTLYIDGMSEEAATEDSPEDLFFMSLSSLERTELCSILMEKFNSCLTATQRRRVWLHLVDGKTLREIAALEGTTFLSIYESVKVAKNKILKNIKNMP